MNGNENPPKGIGFADLDLYVAEMYDAHLREPIATARLIDLTLKASCIPPEEDIDKQRSIL